MVWCEHLNHDGDSISRDADFTAHAVEVLEAEGFGAGPRPRRDLLPEGLADVRRNGDKALFRWARRLDGLRLNRGTLWISRAPASAVGTPQAPGHVSVAELELLPA